MGVGKTLLILCRGGARSFEGSQNGDQRDVERSCHGIRIYVHLYCLSNHKYDWGKGVCIEVRKFVLKQQLFF